MEAHLLDIEKVSNGVKGFNSETINISYIGGVDFKNNAKEHTEQKATLLKLLRDEK
jgi:N-acetylmuramoyl-L-alanine amidase